MMLRTGEYNGFNLARMTIAKSMYQLSSCIVLASVLIEHVMLYASWCIDIPECFTRKVLHLTIIFSFF